jgi:CheY-like chemotaxis protein
MLNFDDRRKLPTLLLIDDDLVSREVTATVLTMSGYTVHTAVDGDSAVEMLNGAFQPDAILMDAQMPGLSGTRLIAELRIRSKARVLAISGSNPPHEVVDAADGFLLKPFSIDALGKLLAGPATQLAQFAPSRLDPNEPVISPEILAQFRSMMPETAVREIYVAVVNDLTRRLQALEAAIAKGDDVEIRRMGHSIKGGCGMAGAMQAARLGALLEEACGETESNQLDNRMALLGDLRTAARNLERMLGAEISS